MCYNAFCNNRYSIDRTILYISKYPFRISSKCGPTIDQKSIFQLRYDTVILIKFSNEFLISLQRKVPEYFRPAFKTIGPIVQAMLSYHVCGTRVTLDCFVTRSRGLKLSARIVYSFKVCSESRTSLKFLVTLVVQRQQS